MERSFKEEVKSLRLGEGETFVGEGILAVTKALLQSGVSYVGGYQGAPISHLIDVLGDASDLLEELGVHLETNASEAAAAAMLGASINYPIRGAVAWKSTVGTNVASDALANLSSAGVRGGALIVIGEDYGEGSSIMQERTHAFAMKSQIWLLDPRPDLPTIVRMVEEGFELSEASHTPVMLELRIRACHVHGSFRTRANRPPAVSTRHPLAQPDFDYGRIVLPPSTYTQEKHKVEVRWPRAQQFVHERRLNEVFDGDLKELGIICQGGMYNATVRALQLLGLADAFGASRVPICCLNVTYPLIPEEIQDFCRGRRAVLVVEEGQPNFIEEAVLAILRRGEVADTRIFGKDVLPMAGEYTGEVMVKGVLGFVERSGVQAAGPEAARARHERLFAARTQAGTLLGGPVPPRPPGFCVGCPERPVFSAMKLLERESGALHVSADIGCHLFSSLPPFNIGNTVLGYGLGLASNAAIDPLFGKRTVTVMGDGGFWHNGLTSGIANAVFNRDDGVLVIMNNGYTSATGTQQIPSSPHQPESKMTGMSIRKALHGIGVNWVRTVTTYKVAQMREALREALGTSYRGLKVIVAESECQLEKQRRLKPLNAALLKAGRRVVRTRFGIDEDVCSGDHSCIRLSGCPSLTIRDSSDPLKVDPVAHVNNDCVGCGLCGEVAHAAVLCPSFFRAEIVQNPGWLDRLAWRLRRAFIGALQPA